jgi:predicted  nucleic acid-binding Zn-ribbon protein
VSELATLIQLQDLDTRIARLDAEVTRLPKQIEALQAAVTTARAAVDAARGRLETTRKDLRARERELDDVGVKRGKSEARLYEVKTNTEYTAVLNEIEIIKAQKAKTEEEILALMERQEGLGLEIREAETRLKAAEAQARSDEGVLRQKLAAVEADLARVRAERSTVAGQLPPGVLGDYEKILRARGGVAVAAVGASHVCGGCRVSIRPQAIQEIRAAQTLMHCESCGRFLHWTEPVAADASGR